MILVPSTPFSVVPLRSASSASLSKSGGRQSRSLRAGCSEYLPPYSPRTSLNSGSSSSAHTSGSLERRTEQRAPAARRRADQIRQRRLGKPESSTHKRSGIITLTQQNGDGHAK